jgi:hypothetical protein
MSMKAFSIGCSLRIVTHHRTLIIQRTMDFTLLSNVVHQRRLSKKMKYEEQEVVEA